MLSLVGELNFHVAALLAIVNVLACLTILISLGEVCAVLTLHQDSSIIFADLNMKRLHLGRGLFWKLAEDELKVLVIRFDSLIEAKGFSPVDRQD